MADARIITQARPTAAIAPHGRLHAAAAALAVGTLVLTELLVAVGALAWGSIGLFGLPAEVAWTLGGIGAVASLWATWRLCASAYRMERAGLQIDGRGHTAEGQTCTS